MEAIGEFVMRYWPKVLIPYNTEHLVERFGIFTVVVLGEQVCT